MVSMKSYDVLHLWVMLPTVFGSTRLETDDQVQPSAQQSWLRSPPHASSEQQFIKTLYLLVCLQMCSLKILKKNYIYISELSFL